MNTYETQLRVLEACENANDPDLAWRASRRDEILNGRSFDELPEHEMREYLETFDRSYSDAENRLFDTK